MTLIQTDRSVTANTEPYKGRWLCWFFEKYQIRLLHILINMFLFVFS